MESTRTSLWAAESTEFSTSLPSSLPRALLWKQNLSQIKYLSCLGHAGGQDVFGQKRLEEGEKSCFKTGIKMWLCKEEEPAGAAFKRWLSWRCQRRPQTGTKQRLSLRRHFLSQGLRRVARVSLGSTKGRFVNTTVKLSGDRDLSFEIHEWCFSKLIKLF